MEETNLDQFTLNLDDSEELNAAVLTNLLNSGVEEALSRLSPAQLMQLERNVQKLKRQKAPSTGAPAGSKAGKSSSSGNRKRSLTGDDTLGELAIDGGGSGLFLGVTEGGLEMVTGAGAGSRKGRAAAAHMNLPASAPQIEYRDGIEWLHFTYSTKGHSEYCIRADIEDLSLDEIPEEFKADNCVYPRALVERETYIGNRWEYETQVNDVAWKLCWKNPEALCGKRGLIQRAVDSYRNRASESRSRRVMRQDKMVTPGSAPRRRASQSGSSAEFSLSASGSTSSIGITNSHAAGQAAAIASSSRYLTISYTDKDGQSQKLKVNVEVESVPDLGVIPDDFKRHNCLYPQALHQPDLSFAEGRWDYETACNELGWRLAWLNAPKIVGRRNLLQKAVDAYQTRIEASERARQSVRRVAAALTPYSAHPQRMYGEEHPSGGKNEEEFSQLVAHTLQQALNQHVQPDEKSAFPQMM